MQTEESKKGDSTSPSLDQDKSITSHTIALVALCISVIGPIALAVVLFLSGIGMRAVNQPNINDGAYGAMGVGLISFWFLFLVMIINFVLGILAIIFGMRAINISKGKKMMPILATSFGFMDILAAIASLILMIVIIHPVH